MRCNNDETRTENVKKITFNTDRNEIENLGKFFNFQFLKHISIKNKLNWFDHFSVVMTLLLVTTTFINVPEIY